MPSTVWVKDSEQSDLPLVHQGGQSSHDSRGPLGRSQVGEEEREGSKNKVCRWSFEAVIAGEALEKSVEEDKKRKRGRQKAESGSLLVRMLSLHSQYISQVSFFALKTG